MKSSNDCISMDLEMIWSHTLAIGIADGLQLSLGHVLGPMSEKCWIDHGFGPWKWKLQNAGRFFCFFNTS